MQYQPASIGAALLSADSLHLVKDRQVLIRLGFKHVQQFSSLAEAEPFLKDSRVQLLLIDQKLADGTGLECLRKVKGNPELAGKAVVLVSGDGRREAVLDAVSAGCGGYVLRPYHLETFAKHLKAAWESSRVDEASQALLNEGSRMLWSGHFDEAVAEFQSVADKDNEALALFNQGLEHLRLQEFGQAIVVFNKTLAVNTMFADAYRGLAYAHRGLGQEALALEYLKKTADLLAIQDKLQELKSLYIEILKADPEAVNPYNSLGVRLRRAGDLSGALHAYTRALVLTPQDENLHYNIAKAYLHAGKPDTAISHLHQALAIRPGFEEAAELLRRLENEAGPPG